NLPCDVGRLALDWKDTAPNVDELYRGGFSFEMFRRHDGAPTNQRPRIDIRTLNKATAMRWTGYKVGKAGRKPRLYPPLANFLDVSSLVFALTGGSATLANAARQFGCTREKIDTGDDG